MSADAAQLEPHFGRGGEAVSAGWGACLDEEFCEVRAEIGAGRSRIDNHPAGHRHRIRIRVVAVAEQLVEQHADGEQVGGNVPPGEAGVGRLIGRRARLRMHGVADAGGDIEVKQLRAAASENNVARFDVAVDQPSAGQFRPLVRLGFRPVSIRNVRHQAA